MATVPVMVPVILVFIMLRVLAHRHPLCKVYDLGNKVMEEGLAASVRAFGDRVEPKWWCPGQVVR